MSLFDDAKRYIPGGVNSPVRAFNGVGGEPVFFKSAKGSRVETEDGRELIDYVGSWGPMILGHADNDVITAVKSAADRGLSFGAPCTLETELARKICELVPSIDKVRMVSSGTEATMSAIRLARGHTGRDNIVKFEGCYHGHSDSLLIKAGSGALTLGVPSSPGVPAALAEHTITLDFNDSESVERCFAELGDTIACVIVEPVAGNMNFVAPAEGFLKTLQKQCTASGALLIFDEVMTGFRVALGGAQEVFGITPDLTTFGKIIGGGMPAAAFGGRADVMSSIAPDGPVYQAGTLSGNPLAMAAGLTTLQKLSDPAMYAQLDQSAKTLTAGLVSAASEHGIAMAADHLGGMFGFSFGSPRPPRNFAEVMACDTELFKEFFHAMLARNIYLAPSAFEAGFLSVTHTESDLATTINSAREVFASWV
ncbi:MAG: glutamate-1-semialdehyde 2,1-aminomutase [Pseudomonadota bacterium]